MKSKLFWLLYTQRHRLDRRWKRLLIWSGVVLATLAIVTVVVVTFLAVQLGRAAYDRVATLRPLSETCARAVSESLSVDSLLNRPLVEHVRRFQAACASSAEPKAESESAGDWTI